jgi:hypothetical protein
MNIANYKSFIVQFICPIIYNCKSQGTEDAYAQLLLQNYFAKNRTIHSRGSNASAITVLKSGSGRRDSNPRPSAWEADALPTELLPLIFR